ncbi:MAG: hypothetical protein ACOC5T_03640 [Elusimicrobiota bacterium]
MKGLVVSGIIVGIICALVGAILVLSGGTIIAAAEGWARASNIAFLFSIAVSLMPKA